MRGSRKFCQRGSNSDKFFVFVFLVDEGRTEDPYNNKSWPSSAHQRNAIFLSEMIIPSSTRSWLGILKYIFLTNISCQVFLLSERIVSYKYCVLIRLAYMYTVWSNFSN